MRGQTERFLGDIRRHCATRQSGNVPSVPLLPPLLLSKVKPAPLQIKGCSTQLDVSYVAEFFIADIGSEKFYGPPAQ